MRRLALAVCVGMVGCAASSPLSPSLTAAAPALAGDAHEDLHAKYVLCVAAMKSTLDQHHAEVYCLHAMRGLGPGPITQSSANSPNF